MFFQSWDDRLALEAQKIADTCIYQHVPVKDGKIHKKNCLLLNLEVLGRFSVGQNIAFWTTQGKVIGSKFDEVVQWWINEYPRFKYPDISGAGHYTQV